MKMRTRLLLLGGAVLAATLGSGSAALAAETDVEAGQGLPAEEVEELVHEWEEEGVLADDHATVECLEIILEGGEVSKCEEAPSPILPEVNEIVWGTIFFLAVLALLTKFAFPALRSAMAAREEKIRSDLEAAEAAKAAAAEEQAQYQRQLADARNEAGRIVEEARQAAEVTAAEVRARAEAEAAEIRNRAAEDARLATERAMADLQAQVGELSIELAERIVERNLDRETQLQLVRSYIDEVGRA
jgi:F-type H+-transporting ATPase subunit b